MIEINNNWINIVFVKKGDKGYIYVNKEIIVAKKLAFFSPFSLENWTIGGAGFHDNHIGCIDDIKIFSFALSKKEIDNL